MKDYESIIGDCLATVPSVDKHHILCNLERNINPAECRQCIQFFKEYPLMDKRDEIREGISQSICRICFDVNKEMKLTAEECREECVCQLNDDETEVHLRLLDSMGVVIIKEGELPHYTGDEDYKGLLKSDIYLNAQDHMIKAGYVATERLIKE